MVVITLAVTEIAIAPACDGQMVALKIQLSGNEDVILKPSAVQKPDGWEMRVSCCCEEMAICKRDTAPKSGACLFGIDNARQFLLPVGSRRALFARVTVQFNNSQLS